MYIIINNWNTSKILHCISIASIAQTIFGFNIKVELKTSNKIFKQIYIGVQAKVLLNIVIMTSMHQSHYNTNDYHYR